MKHEHLGRGFTIVELITIVAVVALLIGMLLPAVSRAGAAGRSANCMAHLRQISQAAQQYALQYSYYPPALRYESDGGLIIIAWDVIQYPDGAIAPGPLWEFSDTPTSVQQCPEYHGLSNFGDDPYSGYNYNTTYVGGESPFPWTGWDRFRPGVRYSACRRPATTAGFGDGGYAGGANKFMRGPMNSEDLDLSSIYSGGQAFRHLRQTNVAYLDLHVASFDGPQSGDLATDELLSAFMDYPANGFLSPDDRAYDPR